MPATRTPMTSTPQSCHRASRLSRWLAGAALAVCSLAPAFAGTPEADALRARYTALAPELASNAFQRPVVLQSTQNAGDLKGEVYAVVDHAFDTVDKALQGADHWCDILILPFNVKQCNAIGTPPQQKLALSIGRKYDQPVADAYKVDFDYKVAAASPDYLKVLLSADAGPLGTRDYRIVLEATPLDARRSFVHMSYAYGYGFAARIAMQGYLATVGAHKVGFSVVGRSADRQPVYIGNMRGVIERNTMRYYLAIDAYLDSLAAPRQEQVERRLRSWFTATERYPRQLHEIDETEYLAMKRKEIERQQAQTQTAKAG